MFIFLVVVNLLVNSGYWRDFLSCPDQQPEKVPGLGWGILPLFTIPLLLFWVMHEMKWEWIALVFYNFLLVPIIPPPPPPPGWMDNVNNMKWSYRAWPGTMYIVLLLFHPFIHDFLIEELHNILLFPLYDWEWNAFPFLLLNSFKPTQHASSQPYTISSSS